MKGFQSSNRPNYTGQIVRLLALVTPLRNQPFG